MKKILLSLGVIFTFIAYSWHQRNESSARVVAPPTNGNPVPSTPAGDASSQTGATKPKSASSAGYKDGTYTGSAADAFYGNIQVQAVIKGGKIVDVVFLQYPNDQENSVAINSQAMPYLKQEALQAQSANVNVITGATDTSQAFVQSLTDALNQAKQV